MSLKRRPSGRDCALAQATLDYIEEKETCAGARATLAPPSCIAMVEAPGAFGFMKVGRGAIRLIDLERRAHFARIAS